MNTTRFATSFIAAALAGAAVTAHAGVKYWDNAAFRAFDVGDYVQDGLVLHYDGIRNAGATDDHDPDATAWTNLGSGGPTYDLALGGPAAASAWGEDGFVFAGDAYFKSMANQALPEYYEIQTLVDAKADDATGIGYIYTRSFADPWNSSDTAWNGSSIAVRPTWSQTVSGTTYKGSLVFNTHYYSNGRPMVPSPVTTYDYITALGDSRSAALFTGLDIPTAMPGRASPQSGSWNARNASYVYLGGHDNGNAAGEALRATIKNFRYYSRILSANERAWNRVVDEARYFGRRAALPITNVVVASSIPILSGNEPNGCYAVDAAGHTFSAPASIVSRGRTYMLDGYTLETWNGSAWGAATVHAGETSYAVTDAALVRLTWRWTAGDGLVIYDADDYVQDGLVLHYDGIRNAGLGAPHDSAATTWVNVVDPGSGDLVRYALVSGAWQEGAATGSWTDDGFVFAKNALFHHAGSFTVPTRYTTQAVLDAKQSDQGNITYIACPSPDGNANDWQRWSVGLRKTSFDYGDGSVSNVLFYCAADAAGGRLAERGSSEKVYHYATAMLDVTNAVVFTGTTAPWTATGASYGHRVGTGSGSARTLAKGFSLAGHYSTTTELLAGTIKDFRFYNRVLSDAEIAWNRTVDEARYFTAPNVVVASTRADMQANEPDGEYRVVGSYVFTAPASVTNANGIIHAPAGYAIQPWDDANGVWGAATEHEGASYAYTAAAGRVRLLWRWKAIYGLRTAADYDVSDYVAGGLLFHLDGIRNAGADADHAEAPETWANLGTSGSAGDATIRAGDAERVVNWTDRGYRFDGNTRFFATIPYTTTFTLQLSTDAVQNDQHNPDTAHIYPFQADGNHFAMSAYDTRLYFRTQGADAWTELRLPIDKEAPWGRVTATLDDATRTAAIFSSTNSSVGARKTFGEMARPAISSLTLGGGGSDSGHYLTGTINYFRYYDRVLSADEFAWNREVDDARYLGALAVTNLVVEIAEGEDYVCDPAPGAYKVEGSYRLTAAPGADNPTRYKLHDWDETLGKWVNPRSCEGTTFTYDVANATAAKIKVTWCKTKAFMLIVR